MNVLNRTFSHQHQAVAIFLGAALFSPAFAGSNNNFVEAPPRYLFNQPLLNKVAYEKVVSDKAAIDKDNEEGLEQALNNNFSPEARVRLRKSLSEYAKSTDPEHRQIEAHRREMRESVKARFSACDKDSDDTIDRTETTECLPQVARHFNQVDVNNDSLISLDELENAQARIEERDRNIEAKMDADKAKIQASEQERATISKRKNKQADNTSRKSPL